MPVDSSVPWEGYEMFGISFSQPGTAHSLLFSLLLCYCHCFVLHNTPRTVEVLPAWSMLILPELERGLVYANYVGVNINALLLLQNSLGSFN